MTVITLGGFAGLSSRGNMSGWSLAITPPCLESKVSDALGRFDFEHYVFRLEKSVSRNGRTFSLLVPAFPSYVFVAARKSWNFIREMTDVVGFVKFGGVVAEVPDADVAALASRAAGNKWILPQDDVAPRFTRGQKIQVLGGALQGHATYERPTSPGRAIVLVDLMGRKVPVSVTEDNLSEFVSSPNEQPQVRRAKHHRPRRQTPFC